MPIESDQRKIRTVEVSRCIFSKPFVAWYDFLFPPDATDSAAFAESTRIKSYSSPSFVLHRLMELLDQIVNFVSYGFPIFNNRTSC
mmetsp:Transcript_12710/g.26700  ORF Transcript_12710/g.26700 Transcript_12710/m.26700 type:complete len:86 (+) Transcript_12710:90-347(+)